MFSIQGKSFEEYLTEKEIKLVRTYKGDIERTQTGKVAAFPTSFITVGFDFTFVADRAIADEIEQLFLSANVLELVFDYEGTTLKGMFSATSTQTTELRDKSERHKSVVVSVVSDGTNITDAQGNLFTIKLGDTVVVSNCAFGKVYTVTNGASYYLRGAKLPKSETNANNGTVLVLGNVVLTNS